MLSDADSDPVLLLGAISRLPVWAVGPYSLLLSDGRLIITAVSDCSVMINNIVCFFYYYGIFLLVAAVFTFNIVPP